MFYMVFITGTEVIKEPSVAVFLKDAYSMTGHDQQQVQHSDRNSVLKLISNRLLQIFYYG